MIHRPATIQQLTAELMGAHERGEHAVTFDLAALNRVLEYNPADMTVTVETGLPLAVLQAHLADRGQWLPIDPPNPGLSTIADILNDNASGPRRFGYGTIRDHLLGLTIALADGRLIHNGGKVVKNVAGYDLCKLFVGSHGSLGVMVEATFKVRPLPETEQFVGLECDSLSQAADLLEAIHHSEIMPMVLDLQSVGMADRSTLQSSHATMPQTDAPTLPSSARPSLVLGLAGTREEVDWQLEKAATLGLSAATNLDYEKIFWGAPGSALPQRISVLPSRLVEALEDLEANEWLARAGNGVIYYRGGKPPPELSLPSVLMQRIKETYDPKHLFPDFMLSGTPPDVP